MKASSTWNLTDVAPSPAGAYFAMAWLVVLKLHGALVSVAYAFRVVVCVLKGDGSENIPVQVCVVHVCESGCG